MKKLIKVTQGRLPTAPTCPICHMQLGSFTSLQGARPNKGDYSVCLGCSTLLQFTDYQGNMRPATQEEINTFSPEAKKEYELVKTIVQKYHKEHDQ